MSVDSAWRGQRNAPLINGNGQPFGTHSVYAGCGLFAHRDIQKRDIVGPYTGETFRTWRWHATASSPCTPYRHTVKGSCIRGVVAYANEPRHHIDTSNLKWCTITIQANQRSLLGVEDVSRSLPHAAIPLYGKGWLRRCTGDRPRNAVGVLHARIAPIKNSKKKRAKKKKGPATRARTQPSRSGMAASVHG